ncbi:MAG: hypothetical protein ABIN57_11615 [Chitinophagaceae bacterium]
MANLDVQRKKKSPLPWILLTLAVLAIVGYLIWRQYNNHEANEATPTTTTTTQDSSNHIGSDTTYRP